MIDIKVNFTDLMPEGGSVVVGKTEGHFHAEGTSKQLVAEIFSMLGTLEKNNPEELAAAIELLIDTDSAHIFEINKPK
jgi:hypothetical protein